MILDTSFVEDVAREDPDALAKADALTSRGHPGTTPGTNPVRTLLGCWIRGHAPAGEGTIDVVLATKEIYDVTPEIARKASRIAGQLTSNGQPLDDPVDELIGATGVVHDEPILTRNSTTSNEFPD